MFSNYDMRDAFITSLYDYAKANKDIVMISNDFGAPALDKFRVDLPDQFINGAISEQNIISVAAGMAKSGKKVIVYSIATFISLRALEQIKIDLCVMNLPVIILAVGTGYAYPMDGPTHHATEDIAILRSLSNMSIYSPSDSNLASSLADLVNNTQGPAYIRLDRGKLPRLHKIPIDISNGFFVSGEGTDIAIIATGGMVHRANEVANLLKQDGINVAIIDLFRIKPIKVKILSKELTKYKALTSIEEHTINGGVGSIVAETVADSGLQKPLFRNAINDELLYAYGARDYLHKNRELDAESLAKKIKKWFQSL
jgi:transketolase